MTDQRSRGGVVLCGTEQEAKLLAFADQQAGELAALRAQLAAAEKRAEEAETRASEANEKRDWALVYRDAAWKRSAALEEGLRGVIVEADRDTPAFRKARALLGEG